MFFCDRLMTPMNLGHSRQHRQSTETLSFPAEKPTKVGEGVQQMKRIGIGWSNPKRSGMTFPSRMSTQSVPASIRSSLVSTPIVRSPCGSTTLAIYAAPHPRARELTAACGLTAASGLQLQLGFSVRTGRLRFTRHLERVGVRDVGVGRADGQYDAAVAQRLLSEHRKATTPKMGVPPQQMRTRHGTHGPLTSSP